MSQIELFDMSHIGCGEGACPDVLLIRARDARPPEADSRNPTSSRDGSFEDVGVNHPAIDRPEEAGLDAIELVLESACDVTPRGYFIPRPRGEAAASQRCRARSRAGRGRRRSQAPRPPRPPRDSFLQAGNRSRKESATAPPVPAATRWRRGWRRPPYRKRTSSPRR